MGKFLPGRGIPADDGTLTLKFHTWRVTSRYRSCLLYARALTANLAGFHPLRVDLVSIYIDQCPKGELVEDSLWGTGDIGTELAAEHGVPIYSSINLALCCGGSELAVDGVILIGEHGDYPWNEKGQHLFPRKYFMEQILGVFASSGRSVPVFNLSLIHI